MAQAVTVEQELWNIFTYYTLHGDPLKPESLSIKLLSRIAHDCKLLGPGRLCEADVAAAFQAETPPGGRLSYYGFLKILERLSVKLYPEALSRVAAFERLLSENVLPLASRRCPDDVESFVRSGEVRQLLDFYSDALRSFFTHFAGGGGAAQARATPLLEEEALGYAGASTAAAARRRSASARARNPHHGPYLIPQTPPPALRLSRLCCLLWAVRRRLALHH